MVEYAQFGGGVDFDGLWTLLVGYVMADVPYFRLLQNQMYQPICFQASALLTTSHIPLR